MQRTLSSDCEDLPYTMDAEHARGVEENRKPQPTVAAAAASRPEEGGEFVSEPPLYKKTTAHAPSWATEIARKYLGGTVNQFILNGNVRDLVPALRSSGECEYKELIAFLTEELFHPRDIVVLYDRAAGIRFKDQETRQDFDQFLRAYDTRKGTAHALQLPRDPVRALLLLDMYFRLRLRQGKGIACVLDFAETVIPMAEAAMYSAEDRSAIVILQRWAHDQFFLEHDFTVCLIAENLSNLNQQYVQSPWTAEIHLPMPGKPARLAFAERHCADHLDIFTAHSDVTLASLANNTAGLSFIQLRSILADTLKNRVRLTFEQLSEMKKEMIEEAAFGMLEFVETDYNLDMVAGHNEAKEHLRHAAIALKRGREDVIPMGYLVSGPVGTGKTFLVTCFAGEIGIPMVKLKNFRSQWQGQTEGNLEKILNLLEAMPPVAVMIDEADAALGNRSAQGDSGVSQRVFGQIAAFMSNAKHRGRIIFFLITARPDLMPVDLKRQGRAEEHLALFYPSTRALRLELLQVMMHRTGLDIPVEAVPEALLSGERTYSGADMEAVLTRAKFRAAALGGKDAVVTADILAHVVSDFIPPTYPLQVELQTLAAVMESTSRDLLPEPYSSMSRQEVIQRMAELKHLVD